MSSKKNLYANLKKKLQDSITAVIAENEDHPESFEVEEKRKHPAVSDIIADIENAIQERLIMNSDLEQLIEQSKLHYMRGVLFVDKKCHHLALKQFSKSICCIPYCFHKKAKAALDTQLQQYRRNAGMAMNYDTRSQEAQIELCRSVLTESLAARAEMLRILGHHELAIQNIEEALSFKPESDVRLALFKTHKLCLSEMKIVKMSQTSRNATEVAYSQHSTLANASERVRVNFNERKGRYLEANGDIRAGDILISEQPYASVLLPECYHSHCYHCLKPLVAPIPCHTCLDILYCSENCRETSYRSYHGIECSKWPLLQAVDSFAQLAIRILLTAQPEQLLGSLEKEKHGKYRTSNEIHGVSDEEYRHDYKTIYSLVTNSHLQSQISKQSNSLVSSIISTFLSPTKHAASLDTTAGNSIKSRKESRRGIRLSNSSPALLDTNLNSLADAFANSNHHRKESVAVRNNPERRSSMQIELDTETSPKDRRTNTNHQRFFTECQNHNLSSFYKTMISEDQIRMLIMRHMQQIACNVHMVTTLNVVEDDDHDDDDYHQDDSKATEHVHCKQEYSVRKEQKQIALALYPTASLLNHACDPDVIVSFVDNRLIVRATHNISPGQEITHCYLPHVGTMLRSARQKMLQRRYFFICGCGACKRDEERERRQLCALKVSCPICRDMLKVSYVNDSFIGTCSSEDCGQISDIETQLEEIQRSRELFFDAIDLFKQGNVKKSLATLQTVLKNRRAVLMSKDPLVGEVHEAISRCYEVLREWELASYHCSLSLDSVEEHYGPNSSECAHIVNSLAHFLFNGKLFSKASSAMDRAIKLLSLHYGDEYHAVKVLLKMKECIRNVSSPVSQFTI